MVAEHSRSTHHKGHHHAHDTIDNTNDIIDVRDIIARVEELREERDIGDPIASELDELETLKSLLEGLKGNGGDEQWEGDWYPVTLIRASYFTTYAQELAEDLGAIDSNATWPNNCIDWDRAARELQFDYSSVDVDNVEYFYR